MNLDRSTEKHIAVRDAQRVLDLQDHIGWQENVLPALLKMRSKYDKLLIQRALGTYKSVDNQAVVPTAAELAGRVYGIDFIIELFEDYLLQGDKAAEWIRENTKPFEGA